MSLTFFKTLLVSLQNRIFLKPAWELIGRIIFDVIFVIDIDRLSQIAEHFSN